MKAKPPFAVLFDMDGVLIDSETSHRWAHNIMAERYGFTPAEVDKAFYKGSTLREFYHTIQKEHPFDLSFDDFANELLAEVFAHLESRMDGADPALLALLHRLREQGIPVAVGTSALKRSMLRKLAIVKLHNEFDVIVTSDDVTHAKPNPEIYLAAAEKLGMLPKQCIVVEDSSVGVTAGKAAGMKVIGYSKYVTDLVTLDKADLVINDYHALSYDKLLALVAGKA